MSERLPSSEFSSLLKDRRLFIPPMHIERALCFAAAFRSIGIEAEALPESNEESLRLSRRFLSGEECLPYRVVLGDILKIVSASDFIPERSTFLLPTSDGPCRFGQYSTLLQKTLRELGMEETFVFSPTSQDGYEGIAADLFKFKRTIWRAVVVPEILHKLLLIFRPYEKEKGQCDSIFRSAIEKTSNILSNGSFSLTNQRRALKRVLEEARNLFLGIPLKEKRGSRPLVGIVGEIYLRQNNFSNQEIVRQIENMGCEAWLAGICEWVLYTNLEEKRKLLESGKRWSKKMLENRIRHFLQHVDEKQLSDPFKKLFRNRREFSVESVLEFSRPYLPSHKALGEMTLNTGNAIAFYRAGCDGIMDISPFTCMNGIVTEVVYPRISREHNNIPIRIFYFDGTPLDLSEDLEIFVEQAKIYRGRRLRQ